MRIGFIGAGKVGFSLGRYFMERNLYVSGYYSRNLNSSKEAAAFTQTRYFYTLGEMIDNSDILFLTVPDGTIEEIYLEILKYDIQGKCLVHCSGALSSEIFSGISLKGAKGCSVHPICAVSSRLTGYQDLSKAYFTIEGSETEELEHLLEKCGSKVEILSKEHKVKYHAAAVFASNLVIGLYEMAAGLLGQCGLSESFAAEALLPLFYHNAHNLVLNGGNNALTGPVERNDEGTVNKHLLTLNPEEKEVYRLLSKKLVMIAKNKNPDRCYDGLEKLLKE